MQFVRKAARQAVEFVQTKTGHVVVAGSTMLSTVAHAALPTAASDAITAVNTNITDMIAAIWPLVVAGVVGFGLIKLFKKGVGKAL